MFWNKLASWNIVKKHTEFFNVEITIKVKKKRCFDISFQTSMILLTGKRNCI